MGNNKGLKILIIILIVLFAAILILLSYKFFVLDKKDNSKDPVINENLDEVANNLYAKITKSKYESGYHTFYDLNNNNKLKMAYENTALVNKVNYDNDKCMDEIYKNPELDFDKRTECLLETVKKTDFEESYKDLFGTNNIKYENFYVFGLKQCTLSNAEMKCYQMLGGVEGGVYEPLNLEKYESNKDEIYLYINSLLKESMDDNLIGKDNNIIDNSSYFDSLLVNYELIDENVKTLFEHYKGKTIDYKVTFKKDTNGNYYWKYDPIKFFEEFGEDLIMEICEKAKDALSSQKLGGSPTTWRNLYDMAESRYKEIQYRTLLDMKFNEKIG